MNTLHKMYIISDNFYPKKLTKYSCYTLTNIKVKTTLSNELLVFRNRRTANIQLKLTDYEGYTVQSIDTDELTTLCDCFDLKLKYE
jgi:hypothetical protein